VSKVKVLFKGQHLGNTWRDLRKRFFFEKKKQKTFET